MTELKELADELLKCARYFRDARTIGEQAGRGEELARKVEITLPAILSSLRRVGEMEAALARIAALGDGECPDGPAYDCGNAGDVADAAREEASWHIGQIARSALQPQGGEG